MDEKKLEPMIIDSRPDEKLYLGNAPSIFSTKLKQVPLVNLYNNKSIGGKNKA